MELNAGEIVELAVRRKNVNISELSRRLHINRRTLYNWFRQKKLHTDVICEIGKVINYDFSNDFEEEFRQLTGKDDLMVLNVDHRLNPPDSVYYWMEKYIALLEDYKKLVRKGPL